MPKPRCLVTAAIAGTTSDGSLFGICSPSRSTFPPTRGTRRRCRSRRRGRPRRTCRPQQLGQLDPVLDVVEPLPVVAGSRHSPCVMWLTQFISKRLRMRRFLPVMAGPRRAGARTRRGSGQRGVARAAGRRARTACGGGSPRRTPAASGRVVAGPARRDRRSPRTTRGSRRYEVDPVHACRPPPRQRIGDLLRGSDDPAVGRGVVRDIAQGGWPVWDEVLDPADDALHRPRSSAHRRACRGPRARSRCRSRPTCARAVRHSRSTRRVRPPSCWPPPPSSRERRRGPGRT